MIEAYLTDSIVIVKPATKDQWFEPTATSVETTVAARVDERNRITRTQSGQEVTSTSQVIVVPGTDIAVGYKVRYAGRDRRILSLQKNKGFSEVESITVFLE
jgi:hypothetical protein